MRNPAATGGIGIYSCSSLSRAKSIQQSRQMEIQNSFLAIPLFSVAPSRWHSRAAAFPWLCTSRAPAPSPVNPPSKPSRPCIVLVSWKIPASHVVAEIDIPVGLSASSSPPPAPTSWSTVAGNIAKEAEQTGLRPPTTCLPAPRKPSSLLVSFPRFLFPSLLLFPCNR
jgi:hypothetical protein